MIRLPATAKPISTAPSYKIALQPAWRASYSAGWPAPPGRCICPSNTEKKSSARLCRNSESGLLSLEGVMSRARTDCQLKICEMSKLVMRRNLRPGKRNQNVRTTKLPRQLTPAPLKNCSRQLPILFMLYFSQNFYQFLILGNLKKLGR